MSPRSGVVEAPALSPTCAGSGPAQVGDDCQPGSLDVLLAQSAALHRHLCPRQVLGVRMGLLAGRWLGVAVPQPFESKRLLAIVETDGCFADGVAVAVHAWTGRRTLRVEDLGKVALTLVDTWTGRAVRVHPHPRARQVARDLAPEARSRWEAQLLGYQRLADEHLLVARPVVLAMSLERLVSRAGHRVTCGRCGEEILNERELQVAGQTLCRTCVQGAYYRPGKE